MPFLPRHVCLGPSIANNVPGGNEVLVSGTTVTLVWSLNVLAKAMPCFAFLRITQPSFCKRRIRCLPEILAGIATLMGQSGDCLDMRSVECFPSYRSRDIYIAHWLCCEESNTMFLKKARSLSYFLKGIQVKQDGFFESSLGLRNRTTECSSTQFHAVCYPSSSLFSELKSDDYITNYRHRLSTSFAEMTLVKTKCHLTIILPFVKCLVQINSYRSTYGIVA